MKALLNLDRERLCILGIWIFFFFVNYCLVSWTDWNRFSMAEGTVEGFRDPINKLYVALCAMYAPPLLTMLGVVFASKKTSGRRQPSSGIFMIAITASALWNLSLVAQIARMGVFQVIEIQNLLELLPIQSGALSLITGMLGFYFSTDKS